MNELDAVAFGTAITAEARRIRSWPVVSGTAAPFVCEEWAGGWRVDELMNRSCNFK
jgi:hypothetical protein